MRFGICCQSEQVAHALSVGFEYTELAAGKIFAEAPLAAEAIRAMRAEATNLFVSGPLRLSGATPEVRAYAELVVPRAAKAGISVMVIGSGAARRSELEFEAAQEGFADAAGVVGEVARKYGIVVAPESLKREETNVGNSMGDLARRLAERGVAFTADSHHLLRDWPHRSGQEGAPSKAFWREEIPVAPAHIHISNFARTWPVSEDPGMRGFAQRLYEVGYDGRISLECDWANWETEYPMALEDAKRLFESV